VFAEVCASHFQKESRVTSDSDDRTHKVGLIPLIIAEIWVVPALTRFFVQQRCLQSIWLCGTLMRLDLITVFYRYTLHSFQNALQRMLGDEWL
jgi:hypothetical protein